MILFRVGDWPYFTELIRVSRTHKVVDGERDEAGVVRDDGGVGDHLAVADASHRRHHVPHFDAAPEVTGEVGV